jgi:hypothetical protein
VGGVRGLILILNVYKFYIQITKQNTLFFNGHHFCFKNVKVRRLPFFYLLKDLSSFSFFPPLWAGAKDYKTEGNHET